MKITENYIFPFNFDVMFFCVAFVFKSCGPEALIVRILLPCLAKFLLDGEVLLHRKSEDFQEFC